MKSRHAWPAVALLVAAIAVGCTTVPIYTPRVDFPPRNLEIVEVAILKALANRQWLAQKKGPGEIIGTLNIRSHQAVIRINYNDSAYSIRYVDSTDLRYRTDIWGRERIHGNYNGWIKDLVSDINTLLGIPRGS